LAAAERWTYLECLALATHRLARAASQAIIRLCSVAGTMKRIEIGCFAIIANDVLTYTS
jgi:hypothetical protein